MLVRSHLLGGVAAVTGTVLVRDPATLAVVPVTAGILSAVIPDADTPKSVPGQLLPGISHLLGRLFGHRGATHSLLALVAVAGLAVFCVQTADARTGVREALASSTVVLCAVGYGSHLVLDAVSGGIPLFWPLSKRRLGVRLFKTGNPVERQIVQPALVAAVVLAGFELFQTDVGFAPPLAALAG